uniref:Uncharacterized protein n=1 Tax=Rhizophora mucronata TaxID=61149 RepID=A0A2P2PL65_RHIMU
MPILNMKGSGNNYELLQKYQTKYNNKVLAPNLIGVS